MTLCGVRALKLACGLDTRRRESGRVEDAVTRSRRGVSAGRPSRPSCSCVDPPPRHPAEHGAAGTDLLRSSGPAAALNLVVLRAPEVRGLDRFLPEEAVSPRCLWAPHREVTVHVITSVRVCDSVSGPSLPGAESRKPVGNEVQSPASCVSQRQRSRHPGATQVPSLPRENEQGPRASLRPTPLRPQG